MEEKTQIAYIQAHSIRDLMDRINGHNSKYPENAITRNDIVSIQKEEDTYILLYYK